MEHKLFVDTWGWLTLRDKKEEKHKEVTEYYRKFHSQGKRLATQASRQTFNLIYRSFINGGNGRIWYYQNFD